MRGVARQPGQWDDRAMASSVTQVFLLGRLGPAATLRDAGGSQVAHVRPATHRPAMEGDGEWAETTEWHDVTIRDAGPLRPMLRKGVRLHVLGRLRTRSRDQDGETRWWTEVACRARDVIVLTSRLKPPHQTREAACGPPHEVRRAGDSRLFALLVKLGADPREAYACVREVRDMAADNFITRFEACVEARLDAVESGLGGLRRLVILVCAADTTVVALVVILRMGALPAG